MQGEDTEGGATEGSGAAPALPGADAAGFDARGSARHLLRTIRAGALATCDAGRDGHPLATLVSVATDIDGAPLLLLSQLSAHRPISSATRAPRCFWPPRARVIRSRIRVCR